MGSTIGICIEISALFALAFCISLGEITAVGVSCLPAYYFKCHDGSKCIPITWKCDNIDHCDDSSDEKYCLGKEIRFNCEDASPSIPIEWVCNQVFECWDGSDEFSCTCRPDEVRCTNGQCINRSFMCDGSIVDCWDGSDEGPPNCPTETRLPVRKKLGGRMTKLPKEFSQIHSDSKYKINV